MAVAGDLTSVSLNLKFDQRVKKRRKMEKRMLQAEYYRGSSYSTSASLLVYELAALLNKDSNTILWWKSPIPVTRRVE